jgi:hypothetical protein
MTPPQNKIGGTKSSNVTDARRPTALILSRFRPVVRQIKAKRSSDYGKGDRKRKRERNDADPSTEQLLKRNEGEGITHRDVRAS